MTKTDVPVAADASQANAELCASLIREHANDIIACWEQRVRVLASARKLPTAELLNHIPDVLARIAGFVEELGARRISPSQVQALQLHAIERFEQNVDLAALVTEIGLLRTCILTQLEAIERAVPVAALRLLDEVVDHMVTDAIEDYLDVRERTLHVFDQLANAALDSRSLDELVERLLHILVSTSESIDTASLVVREGHAMRVRASDGDSVTSDPRWFHLGEHVAGHVARSKQPFELRHAMTEPVIAQAALRLDIRVRALYAIPLIDADEVMAVLHMGSLTTDEFSPEDKRLLRAVGARATAAISQHMLREAAERTTRELRRREEEFHALADNIPQFAWMGDARGRPYWYNQRWLDFAGITLEEMRTVGPMAFVHPDHAHRVSQLLQKARIDGQAWEATFPLRGRTEIYRWYLCRAIPILGACGSIARWFGTHTDVTDQRFLDEATKVLNSSLNYTETLQQIARLAVPELADWCTVYLADDHELQRVAFAHANPDHVQLAAEWERKYPSVCDTNGVPRTIQTGEPLFVAKITDQQLIESARDAEHLRDLRDLHLVSCIIAPLVARGRALGAITLITSDSNRTYDQHDCELANELARRAGTAVDNARLYNESQQALRQREQAVHSREEVLAIVSHDLRGPLSTIGMSASLLEETYPAPDSSKRLAAIHRSADRMEHMIDDLLDVATIEANGLTLRRGMEDAERLVLSVIEAHEPTASDKGMKLAHAGALESVRVSCDRERIERVFTNLIFNAIKFCAPGDEISVGGELVDGHLVYSVADTGPGIPAEQVPHLFERYWTTHHQGSGKGSGLGLYICKGIVEAHGGRIWVDSVVGRGSKFSFSLPLGADDHDRT
ncbi:MAG: hypothetical protein JWP01_3910 [Myxococcales bacterium]|nr:hypothetical protein [Myxococcales bacterium]